MGLLSAALHYLWPAALDKAISQSRNQTMESNIKLLLTQMTQPKTIKHWDTTQIATATAKYNPLKLQHK